MNSNKLAENDLIWSKKNSSRNGWRWFLAGTLLNLTVTSLIVGSMLFYVHVELQSVKDQLLSHEDRLFILEKHVTTNDATLQQGTPEVNDQTWKKAQLRMRRDHEPQMSTEHGAEGNLTFYAEMHTSQAEPLHGIHSPVVTCRDGKDGKDGRDGRDGKSGEVGRNGVDGRDGKNGNDGRDGRDCQTGQPDSPLPPIGQGQPGEPGPPGRPGQPGERGPAGEVGLPGLTGRYGEPGLPGESGIAGPRGEQGIDGFTGLTGPPGYPGESGLDGQRGFPGASGETGPPGHPGESGEVGPRGFPGVSGETGAPGRPGERGERGEPGPPRQQGCPPTGQDCQDHRVYLTPEKFPSSDWTQAKERCAQCDMQLCSLAQLKAAYDTGYRNIVWGSYDTSGRDTKVMSCAGHWFTAPGECFFSGGDETSSSIPNTPRPDDNLSAYCCNA